MILDLVIVAIVTLGLLVGYRTGFVTLVVGQLGVLASLVGLSRLGVLEQVPGGLAGALVLLFVVGSVAGTLGARVAGVIRRVPILRGADLILGAAANAVLSLATIFIVLVAIVGLDSELSPLHRVSAIGPGQVAALQARAAANPALGLLVDPVATNTMLERARIAPVPLEELEKYEPALAIYELKIRPQVVRSALLPPLLAAGERLPLIGEHANAPADYPRDQPPSN